ncbi:MULTISPECIES: carbon storage regulator CsrA [Brevibacillus]|uniref:carbon storage regulator CsrA n=1 Tax=Brevibacillus TaxID=55080 RepID=UPI000271C3C4|nr:MULTISPECIES: carbon storage regulator CsrA [Brevibacillus]EJL46894.1 carbon storage regulator CsrA [Brevibacillus sp. CF112]MED1822650.1 carbon storage regulator CsrA [Brevibacillus agri]
MLVLSRKKNESIIIGDQIEIKIIAIEGENVRIGIEAPRSVQVHRKEVYALIQQENQLASMQKPNWDVLKKLVPQNQDSSDVE